MEVGKNIKSAVEGERLRFRRAWVRSHAFGIAYFSSLLILICALT